MKKIDDKLFYDDIVIICLFIHATMANNEKSLSEYEELINRAKREYEELINKAEKEYDWSEMCDLCEDAINKYQLVHAMIKLANYHGKNEDYELMKLYLNMAVEKKSDVAMTALGDYYDKIKDYDNMIKYYEMAIELGNSTAMNNLGWYYKERGDIDKMKKYYLAAIKAGNSAAMTNLAMHYDREKDLDNAIMFMEMAIEKGHKNALNYLINFYIKLRDWDNIKKYLDKNSAAKIKFNSDLYNTFNIDVAINCVDILTPQNKNKLNKKLATYFELSSVFDNSNLKNKNECMICFLDECELQLPNCRHKVCYLCYKKIKECPICRSEITSDA